MLVADGAGPEVRRLDDERVAFPSAARFTHPVLDLRRERRAAVDRDDARLVHHLEVENHVAGHLHDAHAVVVAIGHHRRGHAARDAAVPAVEVEIGIPRLRLAGSAQLLFMSADRRLPSAVISGSLSVRRIDDERRLPLGSRGIGDTGLERLAEVAFGDRLRVAIDLLGRGVEPRAGTPPRSGTPCSDRTAAEASLRSRPPPPLHRSSGTLPTNEIGHIPWMSGSPHGVFGCVHPLGVSMKWLASLGGPTGDCPLTTATNNAAAKIRK